MKPLLRPLRLSVMAAGLALPLIVSSPAQAIPCVDAPNLAQNIAKNVMDASAWAKDQGLKMTQLDLMSMLTEQEIDAQNNGFANMIARMGLSRQDIQNLEVAEKSRPSMNACGTVSMAEAEKQVGQSRSRQNEIAVERQAQGSSGLRAAGTAMSRADTTASTDSVLQARSMRSLEIREQCELLQQDPASADPEAPLATSLCMRGDLITGTSSGSVLTADEGEAVGVANQLIANPLPVAPGNLDKETAIGNENAIRATRREALQNMAFASLQEVSSWRQPTVGGISPMMVLEESVAQHYDPKELSLVSNVDPNNKNAEMPSSVQRRVAQMTALGLHIDNESFKSELRREALLAAILSVKVTPFE